MTDLYITILCVTDTELNKENKISVHRFQNTYEDYFIENL